MPITSTPTDLPNVVSRAEPIFKPPLSNSAFAIDLSGIAGFFGGETAVKAMATVNIVKHRRWCGWYNAPGSYEIIKQYGPLAMSGIVDSLFPGGQRDPASKMLLADGQIYPEFIPVHSSTTMKSRIGHLGFLFVRKARQMPITATFRPRESRHTMNARVTLVTLGRTRMPGEFDRLNLIPSSSTVFAFITILLSMGGCVACALVSDWLCVATIALGIIANGVACLVIGSGKLFLKNTMPPHAQVKTPGDIVTKSFIDEEIVVLFGREGNVRPLTDADFVVKHKEGYELTTVGRGDVPMKCKHETGTPCTSACNQPPLVSRRHRRVHIPQHHLVRGSLFLLLIQFLSQLVLIPQATLFGQLMFIATLIPAWGYHSYLSYVSLDIQTRALFKKLRIDEDEDIHRYQLNTWTEAVVFSCLALASVRHKSDPDFKNKIEGVLDGLLTSKTAVWQAWKQSLARKLVDAKYFDGDSESFLFSGEDGRVDHGDVGGQASDLGTSGKEEVPKFTVIEKADLAQLQVYQADANEALRAWHQVRNTFEIQNLTYE